MYEALGSGMTKHLTYFVSIDKIDSTFPDDFESSPLKDEILRQNNPNPGIEDSYHPVSKSNQFLLVIWP